jgi:hypothetical protein
MQIQSISSLLVRYWRSFLIPAAFITFTSCGGGGGVEIVSATVEPTPLRPSSVFTVKVQIRGDRCLSTKVYLKRSDASEQFDELLLDMRKSHSTSCGVDSFEGECRIEAAAPGETERYLDCGPLADYSTLIPRRIYLRRLVGPLVFRVISKSSVDDLDIWKKMMDSVGLYDADDEVTSVDISAALE